jgi:MYXO-CTERM domain-containing protein
MKARSLGPALVLGLIAAWSGQAHAHCQPVCATIAALDVTLGGAPACVSIQDVTEADSCNCGGSFTIVNECSFEVLARDFLFPIRNPDFPDGAPAIAPGESDSLSVHGGDHGQDFPGEVGVGGPGMRQVVLELEGNGDTFTLTIDATVKERDEEHGCSVGTPGSGSARMTGIGLLLAALALAVRRRPQRAGLPPR